MQKCLDLCAKGKDDLQKVSSVAFEGIPVKVLPNMDASSLFNGLTDVNGALLCKFELKKGTIPVAPPAQDSLKGYYNVFLKAYKEKNPILVVTKHNSSFFELVPLDLFTKDKGKIVECLSRQLRLNAAIHQSNDVFLNALHELKRSDPEFKTRWDSFSVRYSFKGKLNHHNFWATHFEELLFLGYLGPNDFFKKFLTVQHKLSKQTGNAGQQDPSGESVQSLKSLGETLFRVVEETPAQKNKKKLQSLRESLLDMQSGYLFGVQMSSAHVETMLRGFISQTDCESTEATEKDKDLAVLTMDVHWLATQRLNELLEQTQDPTKPCVPEYRNLHKEEEQACLRFIYKVHKPNSKLPSVFCDYMDNSNVKALPVSLEQALAIDCIIIKYASCVASALQISKVPDDYETYTHEGILEIIKKDHEVGDDHHTPQDVNLTCCLAYNFFVGLWPLETTEDAKYLELYLKCWCHPMLRPLVSRTAGFMCVATVAFASMPLSGDLSEAWDTLMYTYKQSIGTAESGYYPATMQFAPKDYVLEEFPYQDKKAIVKAHR